MRYPRSSVDYDVNLVALWEMEEYTPMTRPERSALRRWVRKGFDIDSNPWHFCDEEGLPLNYLQAYRLQFGYSSGPWDYWKGPESQLYWDDASKSFRHKDDFC